MNTPGIWPSVRLSEVQRRVVEWLWFCYIAIGKLHCFFGGGGLGKTMIAIDLAATVTTGRPWPDKSPGCAAGAVAYLTAEDGVGDTILPRLEAAGGDATRIYILDTAYSSDDGVKHFNLTDPECMKYCEATLRNIPDLRLLIIDPVTAFLGRADSHKIGDVRMALLPLAEMAERLLIGIVFIHHVNKSQAQKAVHRASGSTAFIDAVRIAFMVDEDNSDPDDGYILHVVKSNLEQKPAGIGYCIQAVPESGTAKIEWKEPMDEESPEPAVPTLAPIRIKRERSIVIFLRNALAGGERPAADVTAECKAAGFSEKEIRTAREQLCDVPRKDGFGKGGQYYWVLQKDQ